MSARRAIYQASRQRSREVTVAIAIGMWLGGWGLGLGRPIVWQIQDPVRPGETVMLFGDGFSAKPAVRWARLPDTPPGRPGEKKETEPAFKPGARLLQTSAQCLKILLPKEATPGIYLLRISDPAAGVTDVVLNRPVLWWAQTDYVAFSSTYASQQDEKGGNQQLRAARPQTSAEEKGQQSAREQLVLRLFGKNLAGPKAQLYLRGPKNLLLTIGKQSDPWAARVVLPEGLPEGRYALFYHSGYGGPSGWSAPAPWTLQRPARWPTRFFNVRDFGADGTGQRDDTAAIQAALDQAGTAGGGIVYLPRGRYQLTSALRIPRFVTLRGERAEWTALFWPDLTSPPEALIQGTNSFALENVTLYASMARHVIVGDLGDKPGAGNVRLYRVRTRVSAYRGHLTADEIDRRFRELAKISGGDSVRLGGDNIRIEECDFYGNGRALFLSRTRNGLVRRNAFYNGRHGWYCLSGSNGLIFEENTISGADLMATGGGINCLDGSAYSQNVYFARNRLRLLHGWDREAMTSDAGGGLYYGPIERAEGTSLTLPEAPQTGQRDWAGAAVFVFSGKGWTQSRRVVHVDGRHVTIDRPWDQPPDHSSRIGITMMQQHYILTHNDFSDAGIAIQFYGTSVEHIVARNRCARAGGYQGIGKPYGGYQLPPEKNPCQQPSWFCQYLDNVITEGNIYRSGANNAILSGDSVIGVYGWPLTRDWPWPYNVGAVVRGNRLENNARIHVGGSDNEAASVSDVVVERNMLTNSDEGIRLDRAVRGIVVRENVFDNVRQPFIGEGLARLTLDGEQAACAERSRLRMALREAGCSEDPTTWPAVAAALKKIAGLPAISVSAALTQLLPVFLEEISERGIVLPHAIAARLVGFGLQINPASTLPAALQNGGGGEATLVLDLTFQNAPAGASVAAHFAEAAGCAYDGNAVPLQEGRARLTLPITLPPEAWGRHAFTLHIGLILPRTQLWLSPRLTVGTGQIRHWLVVGPFPNKSGQPLDLTLYPPEDALNIHEPVAGRPWQPMRLSGPWLDLRALWPGQEPGVAYAVAGVRAAAETPAILELGSSGGLAVMLNDQYLWSVNQSRNAAPAQDRVPLTLRAGDNVLLLKTCTNTSAWRVTAELAPMGAAFPTAISIIPADQLAALPAFAPPQPRATPTTGELKYSAGVAWRLVYADDFESETLSSRWRPALGQWTAHKGYVQSVGERAFMAYAEPLPAPLRIEYEARILGDRGGDLSAFWLRDPRDYTSGLLFGFGSNGNTCNKLLIEGKEVATAPRPLVEPGRWHHIIAQLLPNGHIQLIIDDQLSLDYAGPPPGPAKFAGLWTWGLSGAFAHVRLFAADSETR